MPRQLNATPNRNQVSNEISLPAPEVRDTFAMAYDHLLYNSAISDQAFRLLLILHRYGRNGECFPSQERLGQDMGRSARAIRNSLRELENFGLIENEGQTAHRSNNYALADISRPVRAVPPSTSAPQEEENYRPVSRKFFSAKGESKEILDSVCENLSKTENQVTGEPESDITLTKPISAVSYIAQNQSTRDKSANSPIDSIDDTPPYPTPPATTQQSRPEPEQPATTPLTPPQAEIADLLKRKGVASQKAAAIATREPRKADVMRWIDYVERRRSIQNPGGYLATVLLLEDARPPLRAATTSHRQMQAHHTSPPTPKYTTSTPIDFDKMQRQEAQRLAEFEKLLAQIGIEE